MQRFEFDDGKSKKFWEIALDGNTFTVRYGRIGTDGQSSTKVFPTEAKARDEAEKTILSKTRKGYVEVAAAPVAVVGNPTLEDAIHADRSDRAAWQVYADWLEGQGDPRGAFVAVQLALAAAPNDPALQAQAATLLEANKKAFIGEIDQDELGECFEVSWENGFWSRVKIKVDWDHEDVEFTKLLGQVLRHPSALFLDRLELGLADNEGENHYDAAIKSLVKHGKRPGLRALHIGAFEYSDETEISWTEVGDVSKLWAILPDLRDLQLTGGGIELGKIDAPQLERLMLETGGLPDPAARSIAAAKLPNLEALEIWFGTEDYGGGCDASSVRAILANHANFPKLKRLGLKNADFQNDICTEVVKSPLLARLTELDLSMGTMTDVGADVLLAHAGKLEHLVLNVDDNFISDERCTALRAAFPMITIGDQDEPDGDYLYVSVGE